MNNPSESAFEVTAPVAIWAARYIYGVAKKWWDERKGKKEIEENKSEVEKLMNTVENLKRQLEEKGKEEVNDDDVNRVRQQVAEVKHLGDVIKEDVTSENAFYTWLFSQDMDIEERAEIYKMKLAQFIDKALQEGLSGRKLNKYKELLTYIEVNLARVREARKKERQFGGVLAAEQRSQAEVYLMNCLQDAAEALRMS